MKSESKTMTAVESIIHGLRNCGDNVPREAIELAREHPAEIKPHLIRIVEQATAAKLRGQPIEDDAHLFAVYLLAEMGATEAWPAVREAVRLPARGAEDLYSFAFMDDFGLIIAILTGDEPAEIRDLISDPEVDPSARQIATEALNYTLRDGGLSRSEAIEWCAAWLDEALLTGDRLAGIFLLLLTRWGAVEKRPLIEKAFDEGFRYSECLTRRKILARLERGMEEFDKTMAELRYFTDTVEELQKWPRIPEIDFDELELEDDFELDDPEPEQKVTRRPRNPRLDSDEKVGRNEPCPCGSGKKYKKCCLIKPR